MGKRVFRIGVVVFLLALCCLSLLVYQSLVRAAGQRQDSEHWERVVAVETQNLETNPDDAKVYFDRGGAFFSLGEYEQAVADFTRALELAPDDHKFKNVVFVYRGCSYRDSGDLLRAVYDFGAAIEHARYLGPGLESSAYFYRGHTHRLLRDYEQAVADYTQAIELDPNRAQVYVYRAYAYVCLGDWARVVQDSNKAEELGLRYDAHVYGNRSYACLRQGRFGQATTDFWRYLQIKLDDLVE